MSSNVGLSTPRGSGTSGYVQRNLSHFKPRDNPYPTSKPGGPGADDLRHRQRQPDAEILEHDRKREIEVKVFELRDRLEDEGELDEDDVDDRCEKLRTDLLKEIADGRGRGKSGREMGRKELKAHQVHELARAKIEETEKLRNALGIRKDYEEGSHWRKQEERKMELEKERARGG